MMDRVVCAHCKRGFDARPGSTILGFRKYCCPNCNLITVGRLRGFPRVVYWVFLIMLIAGTVWGVAEGVTPRYGFLAVLTLFGGYALIRDRIMAKEARQRQENTEAKDEAGHLVRDLDC